MSDVFPKDAVIRRLSLEPAPMLGAGRALLMQLAHPAVAQGVADHSEFKRNPFARLQGTVEAMVAAVYGSEPLARAVGQRIHRIHDHVVGPGYRANDMENLLWVHATLVDTVLCSYRELIGPLRREDEETYYEEMKQVAEFFGIPRSAHPAGLDDFRAYVSEQVGGLRVTTTGRDLAAFIVSPTLPLRAHIPLAPALGLHRLLTLGMTPRSLREQFALDWTGRDQARYERARRRIRRVFRSLPYEVRTAPNRVANGIQLSRARGRVIRHAAVHDGVRLGDVPAAPLA